MERNVLFLEMCYLSLEMNLSSLQIHQSSLQLGPSCTGMSYVPGKHSIIPGDESSIHREESVTRQVIHFIPGKESFIPGDVSFFSGDKTCIPGHYSFVPGDKSGIPGLKDKIRHFMASPSSLAGTGPHGWRAPVDCVRANELCATEPSCSSRYRTLRQCLAGRDRNTMLANKECQAALEVLQESPLYDCRCKRGMKKELQCLQIYWSIHLGLTEGEEFYEASPYEPVTSRLSDIFRLASIVSGMEPTSSKSNHCLDAAKACNLNDNCKKLRSVYITTCSKTIGGSCNRRKCHKALRQFFDRVPSEYTYRLLFCSCKDYACAERRRQTIVPDCSYEDKEKSSCLELRSSCRTDHLCRSRLADYHSNCQASFLTSSSCPTDNYQACLGSYAGLIGFDITPNYMDSTTASITVSPWCTCKGSGNLEQECEKFVKDFAENPCLRNAIQAFGNGTDVNLAPKNPSPPVTAPPKTEQSPPLPDDVNDSNTIYDNAITTCATVQEYGPKHNKSKEQSLCIPETQLPTDIMSYIDKKSSGTRQNTWRSLVVFPFLILKLAL